MLDPEFANVPNLSIARPAYQRQDEREIRWLREDIAGTEEIRKELPKLERELLICERDAAEAKLKIIELRAKLDAKLGGAK